MTEERVAKKAMGVIFLLGGVVIILATYVGFNMCFMASEKQVSQKPAYSAPSTSVNTNPLMERLEFLDRKLELISKNSKEGKITEEEGIQQMMLILKEMSEVSKQMETDAKKSLDDIMKGLKPKIKAGTSI